MNGTPVDKVTAFVLREQGERRQFLAFEHPAAGIQLPAGTVEAGEAPEAGVLREAWEETGLRELTLIRCLDSFPEPFGVDEGMVCTTTPLWSEPNTLSQPVPWPLTAEVFLPQVGRGNRCRIEGAVSAAGWLPIAFELFDFAGSTPILLRVTRGWVPSSRVTTVVTRHLFELRPVVSSPDEWLHDGDVPGTRVHWRDLGRPGRLTPPHSDWLARVRDRLAGEP